MGKNSDFHLSLPFHIKTTLSNLVSFKNDVDLLICVSDARSPKFTDVSCKLRELFPKSKILNLISKSDLIDTSLPNAFNFKDQSSKKKILSLIKDSLGEEREKFRKEGYIPHCQIFVTGFPNVGKSTLINLLKNKRVSNNEDRPGVTRKIVRYYLGDNLWLYDSPGVFMSTNLPQESIDRLFLINSIPLTINNYSDILERAYCYLSQHYLEKLRSLTIDDFYDYPSFILSMAKRHNCKSKGDAWDLDIAEKKFLGIIRSGRLKISWDLHV